MSRYRLVRLVVLICGIIGTIAALYPVVKTFASFSGTNTVITTNFSISVLVVAVLTGGLAAVGLWQSVRSRQRLLVVRKNLEDREARLTEQSSSSKPDFGTLWALTQERIGYYHDIAITQSRNSFYASQVATVVGFVLVLLFGFIAAFSSSVRGTIAAGAVGATGAALAAYISSTFLKTQREASTQFKQFFNQPVDFVRMLGAERLVDLLDNPDHKSAAVQQIIKSMMPVIQAGSDLNSGSSKSS